MNDLGNPPLPTKMETIVVTPDDVKAWRDPPIQRELKLNKKLKEVADYIKASGCIPGIVCFGVVDEVMYLLDGQHRREAFLQSEVEFASCDIHIRHFDTMAAMGEEFVRLNSPIAGMRPDDRLRAQEASLEVLAFLRERCPFIGYGMIRRWDHSPMLSMSAVLRAWEGARTDVPTSPGVSPVDLAKMMTIEGATELVSFLRLAETAWGFDREFKVLWASLNFTIVAWLYRRVVVGHDKRAQRVAPEIFCKAMMSLSADDGHVSWLVNRMLSERTRSPAYSRVKSIMARRIDIETGRKCRLPSPAWSK